MEWTISSAVLLYNRFDCRVCPSQRRQSKLLCPCCVYRGRFAARNSHIQSIPISATRIDPVLHANLAVVATITMEPYEDTQEFHFDKLRQGRKDEKKEHASFWLRKMYDSGGYRYFFTQDRDGIPEERINTVLGANCGVVDSNYLLKDRWRSTPYPRSCSLYFDVWPPQHANDLLGWRNIQGDERPWNDPGRQVWYNSIDIRNDENTGYSLFARTKIAKGTWLGQYTGVLRPIDENLPDENLPAHRREYAMRINIGELENNEECWLDATEHGSFLRFASHSCDPNTEASQQQNKGEDRVMAFQTKRDIEPAEKITVNYGERCFVGKERVCCKCHEKCASPNAKPRRNERIQGTYFPAR